MIIKTISTGSKGNAYLIKSNSSSLLLECGVPIKQLMKHIIFDIDTIQGCLISHEHGDHAKSIEKVAGNGIDIYASKGTFKGCNIDLDKYKYRYNVIESKKPFKVGDFKILPFDTVHDSLEPLGFLIEVHGKRLLFATDTQYIKYKFNNINYMMLECNYTNEVIKNKALEGLNINHFKRVMDTHMGLNTLSKYLADNDLKSLERLYLIHLSDRHSDINIIRDKISSIYKGPIIIP